MIDASFEGDLPEVQKRLETNLVESFKDWWDRPKAELDKSQELSENRGTS